MGAIIWSISSCPSDFTYTGSDWVDAGDDGAPPKEDGDPRSEILKARPDATSSTGRDVYSASCDSRNRLRWISCLFILLSESTYCFEVGRFALSGPQVHYSNSTANQNHSREKKRVRGAYVVSGAFAR